MAEHRDPRDPILDPETMAALLEGRLEGDKRAEVMALLARSREARELVAEAAAVLAEGGEAAVHPEGGAADPVVVASAWWRRTRVMLPLAASVLLALGVALPRVRPGGALGSGDVPALVPIAPGEVAALADPPGSWSRTRGGGRPVTSTPDAFRAGYRMVDLARAAAAGETASVRRIAAEIEAPLRGVDVAFPAQAVLDALVGLDPGTAARELDRLLDLADRELQGVYDPDHLLLGRWTAAALAAARAGDPAAGAFFRGRAARATLARLLQERWPAEVAEALALVSDALAASPGGSDPAVRSALETLTAAGGR